MRLRRLEAEFGAALDVEWRSFLLRPTPSRGRDLDRFREYTRSWLRPAQEEDGGDFRIWEGNAGPPSHSIPPHLVAKAARRLGKVPFQRMHGRLLAAYFSENRDITDEGTLFSLWREAALPASGFGDSKDPALLQETLSQHREALDRGVTGVPSVSMVGIDVPILGAQPLETYRRWVRRHLRTPSED